MPRSYGSKKKKKKKKVVTFLEVTLLATPLITRPKHNNQVSGRNIKRLQTPHDWILELVAKIILIAIHSLLGSSETWRKTL